jgi:hypothetical protein
MNLTDELTNKSWRGDRVAIRDTNQQAEVSRKRAGSWITVGNSPSIQQRSESRVGFIHRERR